MTTVTRAVTVARCRLVRMAAWASPWLVKRVTKAERDRFDSIRPADMRSIMALSRMDRSGRATATKAMPARAACPSPVQSGLSNDWRDWAWTSSTLVATCWVSLKCR